MLQKVNKKIICIIAAFFTVLAICTANQIITDEMARSVIDTNHTIIIPIVKLGLNYEKAYGINSAILLFVLSYFYYQVSQRKGNLEDKRLSQITLVGGVIFAFFMVFGNSFFHLNSWDLIFYGKFQMLISAINFIGYVCLFQNILLFLLLKLKNKTEEPQKENKEKENKTKFFNRHPILRYTLYFLICWLPYLIIFYPGTMNMDSLFEIEQYLGEIGWTTHHPILPTIVFGMFMKIGSFYLGNDNLGIFFNTIFQVFLGAVLLSYSLHYCEELTKSKKIKYALFVFFAFFPIWPIHFYTEVKDIYFSMAMLLYVIFSMKFIVANGKWKAKDWIVYWFAMIFVYLFRNNGIFIILFTFPFLAMAVKKVERIKMIAISILAIVFGMVFTQIYVQANDIKKGSVAEALSIPFQQTARYVMEYDLTEEEENTIDKIIAIKDIKENYNPEIVDYVKGKYKQTTATKDDLKNYFILWFHMFLKHPAVYFEATMNSSYGYYFPNKTENKDSFAQFTIDVPDHINLNHFKIEFMPDTKDNRQAIERGLYTLRSMPGIGLLFSCGFYTWGLLVVTLILWYFKRKREMTVLVPLYVVILVCTASPVNAFVRYMQPVMLLLPFVIAWMLYGVKIISGDN